MNERSQIFLDSLAIMFIVGNLVVVTPALVSTLATVDPHPVTIGIGQGDSMEPQIHSGDLMLIALNDFEDASKGETIVYRGQGELIAHEYKGGALAKGVNNSSVDPVLVQEENYRGEVVLVLRTSQLIP